MKKSPSTILTTWLLLLCFSSSTVAQAAPLISEPIVHPPSQQSSVWSLEIPAQWGSEVESFGNQAMPSIFYIQDAHCDYRAQKSIAALIESLAAEYRAAHPTAEVRIALEGASSRIDLQPFREFSQTEVGTQVNDFYMRKGLLSGAEFAALKLTEKASLQGIETPAIYRRNLESYRAASKVAGQTSEFIRQLRENLDRAKPGIFSKEFLLVDENENRFHDQKLGLLEYLSFLVQHAALVSKSEVPWSQRYPHLGKLEEMRKAEQKIDFTLLQTEIEKILSSLASHSHGLAAKKLAFWMEARSTGDYARFFRTLIKDAKQAKLDLAGYAEVRRYEVYLGLFETMKGPEVFRELEAWTAEIKAALYRSEIEKQKDEYGVLLRFADKVARLEATRQELEACENAVRDKKITAETSSKLAPAFRFYADAKQRDKVLFENLRALLSGKKSESKEAPLTFFVTGGFHSDALAVLLRREGIAYRMLAPRFEQGEENTPYAELMRGRISPLRQVAGAFKYDAQRALAHENLVKVDFGARRELFYKFRFNASLLKAGPEKIRNRELIEPEFSDSPFPVKTKPDNSRELALKDTLKDAIRRKDFGSFKAFFAQTLKPVSGVHEKNRLFEFLDNAFLKQAFEALTSGNADTESFTHAIEKAEKKALLDFFEQEEIASLSARIKTIELRKNNFFKNLSGGKTTGQEIEKNLTDLNNGKLALEALLEKPETRFELLIAHHKAQQALVSIPREAVKAEPEQAAVGGPEMLVLAASLGTETPYFEDPMDFQELVDTLRQKFEYHFRNIRVSGLGSGFDEAENDFLRYVYMAIQTYSLDAMLTAFGQIRTIFGAERDFVRSAGMMFPFESDVELDENVHELKIKLLDEAAADAFIRTMKGRALKRFDAVDFKPDQLDETEQEVYQQGLQRLTGLLQAYREIASQHNWSELYNQPARRSLLDPRIARNVRSDMIVNLYTIAQAFEETLRQHWRNISRQDKTEMLRAIENSHWSHLVVQRLIHEIPSDGFPQMRLALEKVGTDEARDLLTYIAAPGGFEGPAAQSLGVERAERQGPQAFWDVVQEWNQRYAKRGSHLAFQRQEVDVTHGIGSIEEFDTIKQAMNALAGGQHPGLSGRPWIESPEEYQTIMTYLRDQHLISPEDEGSLGEVYEYLESTANIFLRNRLSGELTLQNMETFLNARSGGMIDRTNIDQHIEQFYKEFYRHADTAFEVVTRVLPALYQAHYPHPTELVESLDQHFVVNKRAGLYFDLRNGFVEGDIREIDFRKGEEADAFYRRYPELFFRAFEHGAAYQLPLSPAVSKALKRNIDSLAQFLARERDLPASAVLEELNGSFRNIFRSPNDISAVMWQMHRLGILDAYIPHYSRIRNLFTESAYHRFSVDMHTMYNMQLMEDLAEDTEPALHLASTAYKKVRRNADQIMILRLALLFHDIGKGLYSRFGPGHAVTGAQDIVPPALAKMGLRSGQIRQVSWLVRYHMALNAAADRVKDHPAELYHKTMDLLADPGIDQFLLNALFVISFADKFAVDPGRREFLIKQGRNSPLTALDTLYLAGSKILDHPGGDRRQMLDDLVEQMRRSEETFAAEIKVRLEAAVAGDSVSGLMDAYLEGVDSDELKSESIRQEILQGFAPGNFSELFDAYLSLVPLNYIKTLDTEEVLRRLVFLRHIKVLKSRGIQTALVMFAPFEHQHEKFYEIHVGLTFDEPGLVAKLTGALSANGVDVNGAEVNTSGQGVGMDRFFGFLTLQQEEDSDAELQQLERTVGYDMRLLVEGRFTVRQLFDIKGKIYGLQKKITGELDREPEIRFEENAELDGIPVNVLNVSAMDRIGLLHFTTDLLARNGINVVKISATTYNYEAKDTLFINKNGRPLTADEQAEIARSLFDLLDRNLTYGGASLGQPEQAADGRLEMQALAGSLGQPEQAADGRLEMPALADGLGLPGQAATRGSEWPARAASLGDESGRHVERWAYLGKGGAMLEAAVVEKSPVTVSVLEPALAALDKKIKALGRWKQAEKTLAGKVLGHLQQLAAVGQIYGFDELRWADDDYLVQFVSSADITLGRGFFDPGAFNPDELAHLLFYTGLKHLALQGQADFLAFEDDHKILALENTVFSRSRLWTRLNQFITLDDPVFFQAALNRFNGFEQGSPYFGTINLFDQWMQADMRGQELPVVNQAAYLMRVFLESETGQAILNDNYKTVDTIPVKDRRLVLEAYGKVLAPLFAFSIFRDEFFHTAKQTYDHLTVAMTHAARVQNLPMSLVDMHQSVANHFQTTDPFNPLIALAVSLPGPFSDEGFDLADLETQARRLNDLTRRAISNKAWYDRHQEAISQHSQPSALDGAIENIEVPGAGWTSLGHLGFHFALLTHQSWEGWSHLVNLGYYETVGFGLQQARDVRENESVKIITVDAVPKGSLFLPRSFVQQSYRQSTDTVIIQRSRQIMARDLIHWLAREFDVTLTTKPAFLPFLYAVLKARKNITQPTVDARLPEARYAIDGVNPLPWAGSILRLAALNDLAFWPMVRSHHGSLSPFLEFTAGRTMDDDDITLFWYYSMFTHPRGIFAWLAGKHPDHQEPLSYVDGTDRLTDESARDLLDALMGILWSGPMGGDDLTHRKGPLFQKFLEFVRLTPNGIFISDSEGFQKFLSQDLTEEVVAHPSPAHFETWRAERFPEDIPEEQIIGHVILAKEPDRGQAEVLTQDQPSYFYPLIFAPSKLLYPEKWPWNHRYEPSLAIYVAEYQNGILVPAPENGVAFKYVIQGIPNGTALRVAVFPDGNMLIQKAYDQSGKDTPAYVKIPLAQAQGGVIAPQRTWQRIPVVEPGQHADRFYHTRVQDDGFLILRLGEHVISLSAPSSGGKDLLIQIHEGALLIYDTAQPAYLGKVSFNGRILIEAPNGGLSLLPELPESVRDNHFQNGKEHAALRGLAQALKDVLKLGLGYKKIVISDESEIRLEGDKILLPRAYLGNPQLAAADVEKHLSSHDLLRKLETHVAELNRLEKSPDIFDENVPIPDDLGPVSPAALAAWAEPARRDYAKLMTAMETVHKRLVIIRNIGRHRYELGTMASAERLRRTLSQLLQQTPQDFLFLNRSGGSTIYGIRGMRSTQGVYQHYEGVGYATDQFYTLDADHDLVLGERSRPAERGEESRRKIFVRFRKGGKPEGKLVLLLFDAETGQLFDEEKNQLSTRMEQLYEAVPLLNSEPGLKEELQKALAGTESVAQQIQVLDYFRQFLPRLLASEHPPVNAAMLRMVFTAVARGGMAQAQRLNGLFTASLRALPNLVEEFEILLLFFDLHPSEEKNQQDAGYPARFAEFVSGVLVPLVQSPRKEAPDFSDPAFFEEMTDYLTGIQHQVQALWDVGSIKREGDDYKWDGLMAQRFSLVERETDEPNSIHRYFMKLGPGSETPVEVETEAITPEEQTMSRAERKQRATHLTFLGGADGIGASSMEVAYQGMETPGWTRILVDAGAQLDEYNTPPAFRFLKDTPNAVFLTHSHIDHVGSAVFLYRRLDKKVPFFATRDTVDLLRITLHAMVRDINRKLEEYNYFAHTFFTAAEVEEFLANIKTVDPVSRDEDGTPVYPVLAVSPKMKVQFHHAGHLHGAASLIVMTPDGNTFISGDISKRAQGPVPGFRDWAVGMPPIHTAVMESTYGMAVRESEDEQEAKLIQNIVKVLKRGGKVLLPAYANGRAPRLLDVILRRMNEFPPDMQRKLKIFVDGIAASFTEAYQNVYPGLRDNRIELIGNKFETAREGYEYREERILGKNEPAIIIASSANLQGMSAWYGRKLAEDSRNGIFFTGYMDPLEPASALMDVRDGDTFQFREGEDPVAVRAERNSFKLSGHASGKEILDILGALDRAGNLGISFVMYDIFLMFVKLGFSLPGAGAFFITRMIRKLMEGSLKRVIFVHGSPKARGEIIGGVKAIEKHAEWHPIDSRVGQSVIGVADPENKVWFAQIPAVPLSEYQAASLGDERRQFYALLVDLEQEMEILEAAGRSLPNRLADIRRRLFRAGTLPANDIGLAQTILIDERLAARFSTFPEDTAATRDEIKQWAVRVIKAAEPGRPVSLAASPAQLATLQKVLSAPRPHPSTLRTVKGILRTVLLSNSKQKAKEFIAAQTSSFQLSLESDRGIEAALRKFIRDTHEEKIIPNFTEYVDLQDYHLMVGGDDWTPGTRKKAVNLLTTLYRRSLRGVMLEQIAFLPPWDLAAAHYRLDASSLGTEKADHVYSLLGKDRVQNLNPHFVESFLALAGHVPAMFGAEPAVVGLYRKARLAIEQFNMFFIHGNLVLDKETGKAILFAGDRELGKSVVAAALVHDPSGKFEFISDNNVLAMMKEGELFAGPAAYLNPRLNMPPSYRDREGRIIRYARPIHGNYRFFPVGSIIHFTRNDMAAFSKVSGEIEASKLFESLTNQIDELATPAERAADVLHAVGRGSVRAITVGVPTDQERRNYPAVADTVKQILAQSLGIGRQADAERLQKYLNDIFGQPGDPWIYPGRWENYKILSTPWYYRVGSMFYLPYVDQEFQTRLFNYADNLINPGIRRYYADEDAYRGLLGSLSQYRDNWVVARLRSGNLTSYLNFASGFFTLSTLLGLMEDRDVIAGQKVLIAGSAGGIQSVTASRLGADYVLGIDNDPALIDMADKLADWNGVSRERLGYAAVDFKNASEETLSRFDYLAANLPEWGLYSEGKQPDEKWFNWHQLLVESFPGAAHYLAAGETIGHPISGWVEHILKSTFRDVSIAVRISATRSDYIAWRGADRKIEGQSLGQFVPLIGVNVHRQDTQTTENVEQIHYLYDFLRQKRWLHGRQIDVKEQAVSRLVEAITAELANYSEHFLRFFMEGGKLQVCCTEILVGMFDFAVKNPEKRMEIHLPLEFIYYPDAQFKVFDSPVEDKADYVMNTVKSALEYRGLSYRIYDNNRIAAENHPGRAKADVQIVIRMWSKTDNMLSTFERDATASSLGQEAAPERSVQGLLDALRDLSSEIESAAAKIPAAEPVMLMITGQSGTYKTQLAKLLKAGIAGFSPEDIDIIGTDDLTEGELTKRERFWQLTSGIETDLFWDFLARKRPDGRPFKLKIVEGFHGPDFFDRVGFSPHVDMVVISPAKMRILTDILRYGVLGPVNFLYMLNQDSLADFKEYQGPRFSRIRFANNMEWPWVKWKMSWQYNGGKRAFDAAAIHWAARHEKLSESLLTKFLEPHWTDHLFRTVYALRMPKPEPMPDLDSLSEAEAQSLGEVPRLFDTEAGSGLAGADISKLAGLIERADRVWGHARLMERIERETAAYIKKLTEEHRAALEAKIKALEKLLAVYFATLRNMLKEIREPVRRPRLSMQTEEPRAKAFLKRVFPADAKLAVIFSVSDARGAYSLESASYRNAVRSVLESNPLAVIRIAHTGSSPERVQAFQREFAEFGSRVQIESAESAHIPYVLNGFLNDALLNQVKSLSGKSSLKKTELTRYISVVADPDVLDQFRKIALGGKELVSMVRSKLLESKDAALTEGAVLFEWGMAHFVAFSAAEEIRREISEDELAIRGNRYIPNEAGLAGLLTALGEAWQGIQATLRAA